MSEKARREKRRRAIPDQARINELAEYFDRADVSDPSVWVEADDVVIERPELEQISMRLPKEDLDELRRRAAHSGVGYTTLIRMILREHLHGPLTR